jgi:hypothetical protein
MTDNIQFDILTDYSAEAKLEKFDKDLAQLGIRLDQIKRSAEGLNRVSTSLTRLTRATKDATASKVAEAKADVQLERAAVQLLKLARQRKTEEDKVAAAKKKQAEASANAARIEKEALRAAAAARLEASRAEIRNNAIRLGQLKEIQRAQQAAAASAAKAQIPFGRGVGVGFGEGVPRANIQSGPTDAAVKSRADALARAAENANRLDRVVRRVLLPTSRLDALTSRVSAGFAASVANARGLLSNAGKIFKGMTAVVGQTRLFNGTIARSIKSVSALALLFAAIQGFSSQIAFADQIVRAEPQIAGLIASTGQLVDAQGELLKPAEAFPRLLQLSRDQINLLQKDAVKTSATFAELLENFQTAIGPGLSAGLNVDEIRNLTVSISQAATAIGLDQSQLAEEIRSLFTGAINPRNSRIATILGVTPADVKAATEAGELPDFLQGRLSGITQAAAELDGTLTVAFSNVQDAILQAGVEGAEPFRQQLLELAKFFRSDQGLGLATAAIGGISDVLVSVTAEAQTFLANLSAESIRTFAGSIAEFVGSLRQLVVGLAQAVNGLAEFSAAVIDIGSSIVGTIASLPERFDAFLDSLSTVQEATPETTARLKKLAEESAALAIEQAKAAEATLVLSETIRTLETRDTFVTPLRSAEAFLEAVGKTEEALGNLETQLRNLKIADSLGPGGITDLLTSGIDVASIEGGVKEVDNLRSALEGLRAQQIKLQEAPPLDFGTREFTEFEIKRRKLDADVTDARIRLARGERELLALAEERNALQEKTIALTAQAAQVSQGASNQALKAQIEIEKARLQAVTSGGSPSVAGQQASALRELEALEQQRQNRIRVGARLQDKVATASQRTKDIVDALVDSSIAEIDLKQELLKLTLATTAAEESAEQAVQRRARASEALERASQARVNSLERSRGFIDPSESLNALRADISLRKQQLDVREQFAKTLTGVDQQEDKERRLFQIQQERLDLRAEEARSVLAINAAEDEAASKRRQELQEQIALAVELNRKRFEEFQAAQSQRLTDRINTDAGVSQAGLQKQALAARALTEFYTTQFEGQRQLLDLQEQSVQVERTRITLTQTPDNRVETQQQLLALEVESLGILYERARLAREEAARTQTGAGLQRGLENQQLGNGEIAQNFVGDAVGALRGGLQGALRDAFDPNINADLGQSLLLIGQNIAFALGDALLEQFLIQPLIDSLTKTPEDIAKDVALTANTAALTALTAAISTQGVTSGITGAAAIAGKASGGPIPGANLRSAPRGLPSTDRTLIAATPGEFMLRKSSSDYLGKDFLSALNRDPSIIDPYLGRNRRIPGYAAGGSIGDSSPSRVIKTSGSSGTSSAAPQQILVVTSENARAMFSSSQFDIRAAQSAKVQRLTNR